MAFNTILVEQIEAVTFIRLNRPDSLNALNSELLRELIAAFESFEDESNQRCLLLTGNEKAFAAGADIKEMGDKGFAEVYRENFLAGCDRLSSIRKPWIAAVAGYALGGGCEIAMMADLIIAAETAKFGQPEIKLGVSPGLGGSQRLPRAIGKAKAMDMCLTGRFLSAEEAEKAGLVSRVVPSNDLIAEAMSAAKLIGSMPPLAAMANKEMINISQETSLAQGLAFERRLFNGLYATEDKTEGMRAFVEKRPAVWRGR